MRAKTKKDLVIQAIIGALIVYVLFIWHPDYHYKGVIKIVATVLAAMLYGVINKLWKWKEADEDDEPLWYEKDGLWRKKKQETEDSQPNLTEGYADESADERRVQVVKEKIEKDDSDSN